MADKDKDEQEHTIADDLVVTKYKMAGEISNRKFRDQPSPGYVVNQLFLLTFIFHHFATFFIRPSFVHSS